MQFFALVLFFNLVLTSNVVFAHYRSLSARQIADLVEKNCVLLLSSDYEFDDDELEIRLEKFLPSFESESVSLVYANFEEFFNDPYVHVKLTNAGVTPDVDQNQILIVHRRLVDRTCLYKPHLLHQTLTGALYDGPFPSTFADLLSFVNTQCGIFLDVDGKLNDEGVEKKKILENLYSVKTRLDKITMKELKEKCGDDLKSFFYTGVCRSVDDVRMYSVLPRCDVVEEPLRDAEEFRRNILRRSKPTVFKRLASRWQARSKWTNEFFRENFGSTKVHVKLTSSAGVFEGVEPMSLWSPDERFSIPDEVRRNIQFPDIILVRPAGVEMTVDEFIDLIEKKNSSGDDVSAYMEYTHLNDYFKNLEDDLEKIFFADAMRLKHLNFWYSDGNTIGKLHFDEYDNFLCQLKGRKQVILFEPHNNRELYEGYIVEGELTYDDDDGRFLRKNLKESTALTMSPVNIVHPDFRKFPLLSSASPLNCTIDEGDVLFIPSFWWHEVQSYPNSDEQRNLAINYWYEPYFQKEFPCAECKLNFNSFYRNVF